MLDRTNPFGAPGTAVDDNELAWVFDCIRAGDTLDEIAVWSGRSAQEWATILRKLHVKLPVPMRDRLTGRLAEIAAAYEANVPYKVIARAHGISVTWLTTLVRRMVEQGALVRRPVLPMTPEARERLRRLINDKRRAGELSHNPERNSRILAAIAAGKTFSEVGREAGVTRSTVAGVVRRDRLERANAH